MPLFKGYCSYFLDGILKNYHFEAKSSGQVAQLESQIKSRPGVAFKGTNSTRDYKAEAEGKGVTPLSSKSIRKVFKGE